MAKPQDAAEYFIVTLPWIIIIIGLIGNAFCAVIVLRKQFRNKNIGVYLLALAILDTVYLLCNALFHQGIWLLFEVNVQTLSATGCAIVVYVDFASRAMSAWILVVLTVERMLALAIPHLAKSLNTKKRAVISTIVVVVVQGVIYTFVFKAYTVWEEVCSLSVEVLENYQGSIIDVVDFLNYSLIPSVVMATANSVLIYLLKQSQELRSSQGGTDLRSITIMVVTTNIAFIVFTMPFSIYIILYNIGSVSDPTDYIYIALYSLNLLNHAINFLLYCVSAATFRKEVKLMFTGCCKRLQDVTSTTSLTNTGRDQQLQVQHIYTNPALDVPAQKSAVSVLFSSRV